MSFKKVSSVVIVALLLFSCNDEDINLPPEPLPIEYANNIRIHVKGKYLDMRPSLAGAEVTLDSKKYNVFGDGFAIIPEIQVKEHIISFKFGNIINVDTLIQIDKEVQNYSFLLETNLDTTDLNCDYFPLSIGNKWTFITSYNPNKDIYYSWCNVYVGVLTWEVISSKHDFHQIRQIYDGGRHLSPQYECDSAVVNVTDTTFFNITENNHVLKFPGIFMTASQFHLVRDYNCDSKDILDIYSSKNPQYIYSNFYPHSRHIILERGIGIKYFRSWREDGHGDFWYEMELVDAVIKN